MSDAVTQTSGFQTFYNGAHLAQQRFHFAPLLEFVEKNHTVSDMEGHCVLHVFCNLLFLQ